MTDTGKQRLSTNREIWGYSMGAIGSNIAFALSLSFLLPFFNTILGISSIAVGTIFLVSRLIDAVTDPIMGLIADRTRTKLGRFRPYIIFGAPLLGITVIALFSNPFLTSTSQVADMAMSTKLLWVYIVYIMYSLVSTVTNIPFHALTPMMSTDYSQRNKVAAMKSAFANVAMVGVSAFTIPLIKIFSNAPNPLAQHGIEPGMALPDGIAQAVGQKPGAIWSSDFLLLDGGAWQKAAIVFAIILTAAFLICAFSARKKDNLEVVIQDNVKKSTIKDNLKMLGKNKALILIMIALGTDVLAAAGANSINMYYWQYVVGNTSYITLIALAGAAASVPLILLTPVIMKKYGKKNLMIGGSALAGLLLLILFFMPMPTQIENPQNTILVITIIFILQSVIAALPGAVAWAMLPDAVEIGEHLTGVRSEGLISSSMTFMNKLGMAIGGFIAGILLAVINFAIPVGGVVQQQSEATLVGINIIRFLLPVLGYVSTIIAMIFYEYTNDKITKIMQENKDKRTAELN